MKRKKTNKRKLSKRMFDKIATGGTVRKFNGVRFTQSGSYRPKKQADDAAKYFRNNSGKARVVKYKKGYVVFTNFSKTRGKLVPKYKKNKSRR